jgi:hypothetical protein
MLKPMSPGTSPAVQSLGLGGMLQNQVTSETDDERKRRIKQMQEESLMGTSGSPATMALFGGSGGLGY